MLSMLGNLVGPVTGLLDKFIEDKDQKNKLAHEIATMAEKQAHELALAQIDVLSLGINYMVSPICAGFGVDIPQADMSVMMPLMFGMLGIGGMRSFDKAKKTDTKKIK